MSETSAVSLLFRDAQCVLTVALRGLSTAVIALVLVTAPSIARSQVVTPVGVQRATAGGTSVTRSSGRVVEDSDGRDETMSRIGLGIVGTVGGTFGGALVGAAIGKSCPFDECTLDDAILGAALGAVLGSGIIAGAPAMGSKCSRISRIAGGAAAALVGGLAGGAIGALAGGPGVIMGFTAGTSIGSGLGASICR